MKNRLRDILNIWDKNFDGEGKQLRLDKFLKVSRLVKRRTVANEACDSGKILVNQKVARASYTVKENDIIEINIGSGSQKFRVKKILEHANKQDVGEMFEIV